jgi:hypothetical protein
VLFLRRGTAFLVTQQSTKHELDGKILRGPEGRLSEGSCRSCVVRQRIVRKKLDLAISIVD